MSTSRQHIITRTGYNFFEYRVAINTRFPIIDPVIATPLMHGPDRRKGKSKMKKDWER